MPGYLKTNIRDYYEFTPALGNTPGDIWTDLPMHGMLGSRPLTGIVITPACDLSNRKVDTLTYIPVVPVLAYFSTLSFLPEIYRETEGQLASVQMSGLIQCRNPFLPPSRNILSTCLATLEEALDGSRVSSKHKVALRRARAGFQLIEAVADPEVVPAPGVLLGELFGARQWHSILERIVTNAYRSDVHFLPADRQPYQWSGIPEHSLALFRFPFSAPVEVFDLAQDVGIRDWNGALEEIKVHVPGVCAFESSRPMKRISLRPRFLADLLTRYVGIHVRLGSPDFTRETVADYVAEIGGV